MTLLNILQTAKEVRNTIISIGEKEEGSALYAQINYILESVMEHECSVLDKKSALRILSVFKATYPDLIDFEDPIDKKLALEYIIEPEARLKAMVGA
jgi:hypothetical protein